MAKVSGNIWHPCSQMKDYELFKPIEIEKAKGVFLYQKNGEKILDAISSWWCKSLGHGNERIKNAVKKQMDSFEHVILANATNDVVEELAERLSKIEPKLNKVFFGGDGSTAMEIATKMALHANVLKKNNKTKFVALKNGYHGETALTLSLSDLGLYKDAYSEILTDVKYIENIPYVNFKEDKEFEDCSDLWEKTKKELDKYASDLCAVVFEPIVQGAGGMLVYSADFLRKLRNWADENDVYLIADEIMTGFGRTGEILACKHAGIVPDFVALSKGLTAGWMAMSVVLTKSEIYDLFYDDYETMKAFLHSNTYAGNALACSASLEALKIYEEEETFKQVRERFPFMRELFEDLAKKTGKLTNIRGIGGVIAGDLILPDELKNKRVGYEIYQKAIKNGAFLRPLGNSVYWLPPLNISKSELELLKNITEQSINEVLKG